MPGHGRMSGHGRGHAHRRGRDGEHSLLATRLVEPALLVFLSQGDQHGYTLLEQVDGLGLGSFPPSLVYRVLREMEETGWVSSTWEREQTQGPPRRIYKLTEDGYAALREWKSHLEQTREVITRLLAEIQMKI